MKGGSILKEVVDGRKVRTYNKDPEGKSLTTGCLGERDWRFPGKKSSKYKGTELRRAWQV